MRVKGSGRIEITGINPYLLVSSEQAAQLKPGWRRPMPVCFRLQPGEITWRINLMPVGDGSFYMYLDGSVRRGTGTKVGDVVKYEIWFDAGYQGGPQHDLLPEFAAALAANPAARTRYDSLRPSLQKEIIRYFARLKSAAAVHRNVAQAIVALTTPGTRWMAREW